MKGVPQRLREQIAEELQHECTFSLDDLVGMIEVGIDQEIKDCFMGQPVQTLGDDMAVWAAAGYDFVVLASDLLSIPQTQASVVTSLANTADLYEQGRHQYNWLTQEAAVVKTYHDVERFPPRATGAVKLARRVLGK